MVLVASPAERLAAARRALVAASGAVGLPLAPAANDRAGGPSRPGRGPIATGIPALDEALGGGLPRGRVVEISGGRSSGRLSLTLALLSRALHGGELAALVDAADALDPRALHPDDRARLLWVRPHNPLVALECADLLLDSGGFALVALYLVGVGPAALRTAARAQDEARARAHARRARDPAHTTLDDAGRVTARRGVGGASWARLAQRAQRARSGLVVVLDDPRGPLAPGVFAHVGLTMKQHRAVWRGRALLETVHCELVLTRNKLATTATTAGRARAASAATELVFRADA